jgi:N-methylhydantoinase A
MAYKIGVDTGGTFTDVVVLDDKGRITTGKALTTYHDFSEGVANALSIAAAKLGTTLEGLVGDTLAFAYGTTIGTNAIATRRGARVGMLTTRGCRDVIHIARGLSRWTGLPESESKHMAATVEPEPLVPKELIAEVSERVDSTGATVCGLDRGDVEAGVRELAEKNVDAVAICFLWSFRDGSHEQAARDIVSRLYPDLYCTTSHEVVPLEGEYERFITTVLDAYVGPLTRSYMTALSGMLRQKGLKGRLLLMKADGAIAYSDEVQPVATVHSGPAAGVVAAKELGRVLGYKNLISTDVGGTTFDVSVITDGRETFSREPRIEKYATLYPTLDIVSIGAGGGTIIWSDPELGTMHVGPQSARSNPGPACYGFGGTEPTITDAALVLGYLNPDYFVGGRMTLDKSKAIDALDRLAKSLNMGLIDVAHGAYEIINSHMSDLIVGMTVNRGLNVGDYVLLAFGGAGPVHVAHMGATLGAKKCLIPASASVYSAHGLATSPIGHTHLVYDYQVLPITAETLNRNIGPLYRKVNEELEADGIPPEARVITCYADMKYSLQINSVRFVMPPMAEYTDEDAAALAGWFDAAYTEMYGPGSGYPAAGRVIVSYMVKGEGAVYHFSPQRLPDGGPDPSAAFKEARPAYFKPGGFAETRVYAYPLLRPGNLVEGPALIEAEETTIVVPPGFRASADGYLNVEIEQVK